MHWGIGSATIDVEPKIRTAGENSIFLPNMKHFSVTLFLFARLTSDHILYLRIHLQAQIASAMSDSRLPACTHHSKHFFACLYFESIKC